MELSGCPPSIRCLFLEFVQIYNSGGRCGFFSRAVQSFARFCLEFPIYVQACRSRFMELTNLGLVVSRGLRLAKYFLKF